MNINIDLMHLLIVTALSFLIGLEVKSYRIQVLKTNSINYFFGSVRTYAFIGILGFVLYKIEPIHLSMYIVGYLSLSVLYALLYYKNLLEDKRSILLFVVMSLVYSFGAIIQTQALWMTALIYVLIVFILNSKKSVSRFVSSINAKEFETLGKMILLSAVILPLLPNTHIIPYIPLSPFKIWLAVVVISGISYGGYIVQKYFFPAKGYFLTGVLGGLYSSTATTVVLARKAKQGNDLNIIDAAIISATSVMYLRLIIIALIFNIQVGKALIIPFLSLSFFGFIISYIYLQKNNTKKEHPDIVDKNPLEMGTAFLFAFLFVVMMMITHFVTNTYGNSGLEILSFIVGFTDIDPFILSILTGKFSVTDMQITVAIMIAAGSNNFLKALYALWFGGRKNTFKSALWISILGIGSIAWALFYKNA